MLGRHQCVTCGPLPQPRRASASFHFNTDLFAILAPRCRAALDKA
jgi:hypothetical protein